nr:MAG TPA: hypothetical protein [Caudoviricetes sp.]
MKINNLTAYNYAETTDGLSLVLGCSIDDAFALDPSRIEVKTDDGDIVEVFAGYAIKSATIDAATKRVTLNLYYDSDGAGAGINVLAKQNAELQSRLDDAESALIELASLVPAPSSTDSSEKQEV